MNQNKGFHSDLPITRHDLVGTSSFYKRESYPDGVVPKNKITAEYPGGRDPWKGLDAFTSHGNGMPLNWHNQGGDAGLYSNDEIHAVRILAMEPTTDRHRGANTGRRFYNHATERLRILGEIPLRKIRDGKQPLDPDGNPDTSFLAKIPADVPFTFQTIDKDGMVLNMAQTWHQLRPGEIRNDCGGCHAHSQKPTLFAETAAAKPDYKVWDLTDSTPLIVDKKRDESKKKWDLKNESGLATLKKGVVNVEYYRDIKPILERSCVACHTAANGKKPAGNLNLAADEEQVQHRHFGKFPGTYYRIALDEAAKFGHKPIGYNSWGYPNASRYVRKFQSRRSLLTWKIFGRRLDGFSNDDHPSESEPGKGDLVQKGKPVDLQRFRSKWDIDYQGSVMPPPAAVKSGKVKPLTDEDRRTLVRWIDLGCPIDLDRGTAGTGYGWMLDDKRPTLTFTVSPKNDATLLIGAHDYYSGLDPDSVQVVIAGKDVSKSLKSTSKGVWEVSLGKPMSKFSEGKLIVSVRDHQGNLTRIERELPIRR